MTCSHNGREAGLEKRIKTRDAKLANPATYQDYSRWNALHQEREQGGYDLERLTHKWADLSAEFESQKSQISYILLRLHLSNRKKIQNVKVCNLYSYIPLTTKLIE